MERLTKILITVWACAAVSWQATRMLTWPELPWIAGVVACAAVVLMRADRRVIGAVLIFAYVFHAVVRLVHGMPYPPFTVLWMAGLLACIAPDAIRTPWNIPTRWRGALIFSALATIVGTAVVIHREAGGVWALATTMANMSWFGTPPPPFIVSWVLHMALILVVGVLWFDWLCGAPAGYVEGAIVTPLVLSAAAMSAVSLYQAFVDISLFNETTFAPLHRATGTMYDANVAGMLAALWVGGTFLWAERLRGWRVYVAPVLMALNAAAAWVSGSRTALIMTVGSVIGVGVTLALKARPEQGRPWRLRSAAAVVFGLALAGLAIARAGTDSPARRLWSSLPVSAGMSLRSFGEDLWARNGYGTAAHAMIRQFPVSGVGVGSFNGFVSEFGWRMDMWLPPDNAQSWIRQQIAELGFVGAIGWILWSLSFAAFLLTVRSTQPPAAWTLRVTLLVFGAISLLSMHGQDLMVAITFWTFAAWYVSVVGVPPVAPRVKPWAWAAMAVALGVFATSAVASATELGLAARAIRLKTQLSYGFAPPQVGGLDAGFRRTQARALAIVDATPKWMMVVVKRADADADAPVEVRVWCNREAVLKATLVGPAPVAAFVPVTEGERVVLETSSRYVPWTSLRRWTAGPGLLVKWEFVRQPPPGFRGYNGMRRSSE